MDHRILQVMDYVFVIGMGAEIWLRVLAEGLLFTPKAVVKDTAGILDISMFIVSLIWVCWMPKVVAPHSLAQILMLLRCFRPLRQELLNIWIGILKLRHHSTHLLRGGFSERFYYKFLVESHDIP